MSRNLSFKTLQGDAASNNTTRNGEVSPAVEMLDACLAAKGGLSAAFEAGGAGASGEVSIDPGKIVGLTAEVGGGAGAKRATQRMVVATRGPSSLAVDDYSGGDVSISRPYLINAMIGAYWELAAQLSLDVGVGVSFEAGSTVSKDGVSAEAGAGGDDDDGGSDEEALSYEALGFSASAKAGFRASASYTYDHFYAEDIHPLAYADKSALLDNLDFILEEGTTSRLLRKEACEFINEHHVLAGGPLDFHWTTLGFGRTASPKQVRDKVLKVAQSNAAERIRLEAWNHYYNMLRLIDGASDGTSFLRLSSHKPDGEAGLYAEAEISASAGPIASGSLGASAFAGVKGSYKKSYARFQTRSLTDPYPHTPGSPDRQATILTTYDASITYSTFSLGLEAEVEGEVSAMGKKRGDLSNTAAGKAIGEVLEKAPSWKPERLNQMRYQCAVATWRRPEAGDTQTKPLRGTGVIQGQSFTVGSLRAVYRRAWTGEVDAGQWSEGADSDPYVIAMATALGTTPADILKFLGDSEVAIFLREGAYWDEKEKTAKLYGEEVGILVEAGYRVTGVSELDVMTDGGLVQLSKEFGKALFAANRELESLRLRYRNRDLANRDKDLFTLGFKIAGTGAKIKLLKVDRAGSDSLIDVRTVFVHPDLLELAPAAGLAKLRLTDPAAAATRAIEGHLQAYEEAVPAAALFCQ